MVGSLGCPRDEFVCINISALYVYIYICEFIYPHHWDMLMLATILLSHAGIGPHYLGGKWSVRTPGVGGQTSGDLRHGTGHQPAPHHPLEYSIPVVTYLSLNLKDKLLKQPFPHYSNISTMPYHLIVICRLETPIPIKLSPHKKWVSCLL